MSSLPADAGEPVGLIFDTDICGDCDDVLALGMIHALESRGLCRLLAVTISVDHPLAAPFADAVNTFYGRGGIPIGVVGTGGVVDESKFLSLLLAKEPQTGRFRYPRTLEPGQPVRSALGALRATLEAQPDRSVRIVQAGFSTNLARLLDSPADQYSPLGGMELVRRKVQMLALMAGAFRAIEGKEGYLEYNVLKDIASAQALADRWPTTMIYSGFEIGIALPYPAESILRDYGYVAHHPLAEAYIRHEPPPHERPTWDLASVLHAVCPDRGYFDISARGTVTVERSGQTTFHESETGEHRYLILRPEQRARVLEALVQLSSQPPACVDGQKR
jgi:inosine-uridine nucleoside N-ribohydrolase